MSKTPLNIGQIKEKRMTNFQEAQLYIDLLCYSPTPDEETVFTPQYALNLLNAHKSHKLPFTKLQRMCQLIIKQQDIYLDPSNERLLKKFLTDILECNAAEPEHNTLVLEFWLNQLSQQHNPELSEHTSDNTQKNMRKPY